MAEFKTYKLSGTNFVATLSARYDGSDICMRAVYYSSDTQIQFGNAVQQGSETYYNNRIIPTKIVGLN